MEKPYKLISFVVGSRAYVKALDLELLIKQMLCENEWDYFDFDYIDDFSALEGSHRKLTVYAMCEKAKVTRSISIPFLYVAGVKDFYTLDYALMAIEELTHNDCNSTLEIIYDKKEDTYFYGASNSRRA